MDKKHLLISKKWHNPQITIEVTSESIGISMSLSDFIEALGEEIGNPAMIMTKAGLKGRMSVAANVVVAEMKSETKKVM